MQFFKYLDFLCLLPKLAFVMRYIYFIRYISNTISNVFIECCVMQVVSCTVTFLVNIWLVNNLSFEA